jgi:hypothetical protein
MNLEEILFDYILSSLIIHEKKNYKKIAKKLVRHKSVTIKNHYGSSFYTYNQGTVNLTATLNNSSELQRHISHPVADNKRTEIKNCVYDLTWLDAHVLKQLNLEEYVKNS